MAKKEKKTDGLQLPAGMTLEVLTEDNQLTFRARVDSYDGKVLQLVDAAGQETPPVLFDSEIRLRGFQSGGRTLLLFGRICGSSAQFWRLHQLESRLIEEGRNFYRQRFSVETELRCVNRIFDPENAEGKFDGALRCRLLDISGGGVQLSCKQRFEVGDWLFLREVILRKGEKSFSFTCRIRRVQENPRGYLYGCQFEGLDAKEQDRILQAVFTAQREEIRAQRGQRRL